MNERIKEIRKSECLTQAKFAERLGIPVRNIINYENGQRKPSSSGIQNICRTFNINETWLLTGEGDMKAPATREAEIASITAALYTEPEDSFRSKFIKLAAQMTDEQLKIVEEMVNALASKH